MPRTEPPRTMRDAIHVVAGTSPAGSVADAGARDLLVLKDALYIGPCHVDPERHAALRREYLPGFFKGLLPVFLDEDGSNLAWAANELPLSARAFMEQLAAHPSHRPVVLWTFRSWMDRISFWWMLDTVERAGADVGRFWVVDAKLPGGIMPRQHGLPPSLGMCAPEELLQAFTGIRPLRRVEMRTGAALWRKYAAPSPLALDRARRTGSSMFPELPIIAIVYGWFFPRLTDDPPRLHLSAADQSLLDGLSVTDWVTPMELICGKMLQHGRLPLPFVFGDYYLNWRIRDWAAHWPEQPALLSRQERNIDFVLKNTAYQLTPHGQRLRDTGLQAPDEAPPLLLGGIRLYDPECTWVRVEQSDVWWIERLS